jgi:integration host factor subunit beta
MPVIYSGEDANAQGLAMATITKKELIDRIAERTGNKRVVVKRIVQNFLDEVIGELAQGNRLEFRDFGVFEVKERAPRIAQNPKTMEKVKVPAKATVKFKVGRMMKVKLHDDEVEGNGQAKGVVKLAAQSLMQAPPSSSAGA